MDCQQVAELVDAYALGAVTGDEARAVEEHVDGCVACWELLREAQDTAALVALSAPMIAAPVWLGSRIVSEVSDEAPRPKAGSPSLLSRLQLSWPAATGALGTAAAAVLVFAISLQFQVNDLQDENDAVEAQIASAQGSFIDVLTVATASDAEALDMAPPASTPRAADAPNGQYHWSESQGMGVIICRNLPAIAEDEIFQAWYETTNDSVSAGTFESSTGDCMHLMHPVIAIVSATGVGVTRESEGGAGRPSRWLLFTSFED